MSFYHRNIISNKFSKNCEIKHSCDNGGKKCLFPNTQEARNFFVGESIEIGHGGVIMSYFFASFKKSCSSLLLLFRIESTSTHFSDKTENISFTLSCAFTVSSSVFVSTSFGSYCEKRFGISRSSFLRSSTKISSLRVERSSFTLP